MAVSVLGGKPRRGELIGDYTAIAIGADFKVHPAWTDFRGKPRTNALNQDVYPQSVSAF